MQITDNHKDDPSQGILVGYNNWSFDDNFLMEHWRKKVGSELFLLIRRKLLTADLLRCLKLKGTLANVFKTCGGSELEATKVHDAMNDCRAVVTVMKKKEVRFDQLCINCRSIEFVQQRATNPLLRAGLNTSIVASKMTRQLTCEQYLNMTDSQITELFKSIGLGTVSIKACISKRLKYNKWLVKNLSYYLQLGRVTKLLIWSSLLFDIISYLFSPNFRRIIWFTRKFLVQEPHLLPVR